MRKMFLSSIYSRGPSFNAIHCWYMRFWIPRELKVMNVDTPAKVVSDACYGKQQACVQNQSDENETN